MPDWLALIVAAVAAAIAGGSLLMSKRSRDAAQEANRIAKEALDISRAEHEAVSLERSKEAQLDVDFALVREEIEQDKNVIRVKGSDIHITFPRRDFDPIELRLRLTVWNRGSRATGRTTVDFFAPDGLPGVRFSGPRGEVVEQATHLDRLDRDLFQPFTRSALLYTPQRIRQVLERIGVGGHEILYVTMSVPWEAQGGFPVAAEVHADEAAERARNDYIIRFTG